MFYYLYQITNLVNAKIYVGVHKTRNMNDGYMGSGKFILRAIEKHGTNNFRKDILEQFADAKSMYAREKEVINEGFLSRKDVYNLRRGGHGGFDYINKNESLRLAKNRKARASTDKVLEKKYGKEYRSVLGKKGAKVNELQGTGIYSPTFSGGFKDNPANQLLGRVAANAPSSREKRIETFKKIGHQQGEKNSGFGTIWITNGIISKKISNRSIIPIGFYKGRKV